MKVYKTKKDCSGCTACMHSCQMNAISMQEDKDGFLYPAIDTGACIHCNACLRTCPLHKEKCEREEENFPRKAYMGSVHDTGQLAKSASGGIFTALAGTVLREGGVVFGAQMQRMIDTMAVQHVMIEKPSDLFRLQGSKYVQSDMQNIYPMVREMLQQGRKVLFSGTSCQVDGLLSYLGRAWENLYTVDLICHGVPNARMFSDYIAHCERKYKATVSSYAFRNKAVRKQYTETLSLTDRNGETITLYTPYRRSPYFRMFMFAVNYRDSCYQCPYATIHKPADITLGDYFEAEKDYPNLLRKEESLNIQRGLSCALIHTQKGSDLLVRASRQMHLFEVDPLRVAASHIQLRKPTAPAKDRQKVLEIWRKGGYSAISKYYRLYDIRTWLPKKCIRIASRAKRKLLGKMKHRKQEDFL